MPFPKNAKSRSSYAPGRTLDRLNEKLAEQDLTLHPTKGYRKVTKKRMLAERLTELLKNGASPFNTREMAVFINQ